jgi:hypothetical protein
MMTEKTSIAWNQAMNPFTASRHREASKDERSRGEGRGSKGPPKNLPREAVMQERIMYLESKVPLVARLVRCHELSEKPFVVFTHTSMPIRICSYHIDDSNGRFNDDQLNESGRYWYYRHATPEEVAVCERLEKAEEEVFQAKCAYRKINHELRKRFERGEV